MAFRTAGIASARNRVRRSRRQRSGESVHVTFLYARLKWSAMTRSPAMTNATMRPKVVLRMRSQHRDSQSRILCSKGPVPACHVRGTAPDASAPWKTAFVIDSGVR